jgi:hypothetical protein
MIQRLMPQPAAETTLILTMIEKNGSLTLAGNETRSYVVPAPSQRHGKVQWDIRSRSNWRMRPEEAAAYKRISARFAETPVRLSPRLSARSGKMARNFWRFARQQSILLRFENAFEGYVLHSGGLEYLPLHGLKGDQQ